MISGEIKKWAYNFLVSFKGEITALSSIVITFVSPIHGLFLIIGSIVIADTLYAIYYSIKILGVKSLSSTKAFNIAVKTFFYMGSIYIAYLISTHILDGSLLGVTYLTPKALCVFWGLIELRSIDETSIKLGNRPFLEIIKGIINKAKSFKKDLNELKK
jgi:hypothetical protein